MRHDLAPSTRVVLILPIVIDRRLVWRLPDHSLISRDNAVFRPMVFLSEPTVRYRIVSGWVGVDGEVA